MGGGGMKPETKYNLLLGLAMVVGIGGFMLIITVVFPVLKKGDLLGPAVILVWAILVFFLLFLRYRIAKKDAEIQAQIKKDAAKFAKLQEEKQARKGRRAKIIANPFKDQTALVDSDDDGGEDAKEPPDGD
jgi:membrane protein insertase Oxa1/YidC/SpoIIIJ